MDKYKITFNTWNKIAQLYFDKFKELDQYNASYDFFCEQISSSNPSVLEIGCGPGNVTQYLLKQRPDFKIDAIDVAPNMIELAKQNNPTVNFQKMDARDLHQLEGTYDAAFCGFCIPYLSKDDCVKMFKDVAALTRENGIYYFSFIEGPQSKSGFETGGSGDQVFVYYYESDFFEKQLAINQFELLRTFRTTYLRGDGTEEVHLIMMGRKGGS